MASGQKLKADFGNNKTYDYVGGLVYDKDGLAFIPTAEGRVLPPQRAINPVDGVKNSFWRYEYQLKDHLGNLRVACRCAEKPTATSVSDAYAPVVVQENHYDVWGLSLPLNPESEKVGGNPADRFTYNGKEDETTLGWIDFNWRHYDPASARFFNVDRLAEKFAYMTPYQFASNDPVGKLELDGLEGVNFNDPYAHISSDDRYTIYSDGGGKPMEGSKFGVNTNVTVGAQAQITDKILGMGVEFKANLGSTEIASYQLDVMDGNKADFFGAGQVKFLSGAGFLLGIIGFELQFERVVSPTGTGQLSVEDKTSTSISFGPMKSTDESIEKYKVKSFSNFQKTTDVKTTYNNIISLGESKTGYGLGVVAEAKAEMALGGRYRFIDRTPNLIRKDATSTVRAMKPTFLPIMKYFKN